MVRPTVLEEGTSATELVKRGEALIRASDERMESVALMRPRALATIKAGALAEIEAFPEFADRYYYSLPRRSKQCDHPKGTSCKSCVFIEGPSVHLALLIQRHWGNSSSEWIVEDQTPDSIWVKGVMQDFEKNNRYGRSYRVSRMRVRDGKNTPLYEDELTLAINAAGSKAQRNAILSAVSDPLKTMLWRHAKQLVIGSNPTAKLTGKQLEAIELEFSKWNVSTAMLERKLAKKRDAWTMEDRATLVGIRNILAEGRKEPDQIFGTQLKKTKEKPVEQDGVHADFPRQEPKPKARGKSQPTPVTAQPELQEDEPGLEEESEPGREAFDDEEEEF